MAAQPPVPKQRGPSAGCGSDALWIVIALAVYAASVAIELTIARMAHGLYFYAVVALPWLLLAVFVVVAHFLGRRRTKIGRLLLLAVATTWAMVIAHALSSLAR